ncbi:unnamed protein product [Amoebophrya sp. A120]|nr:unnamed protein product [Amoebophrya sp. A120]|eukprot:GSA120T00019122001.1
MPNPTWNTRAPRNTRARNWAGRKKITVLKSSRRRRNPIRSNLQFLAIVALTVAVRTETTPRVAVQVARAATASLTTTVVLPTVLAGRIDTTIMTIVAATSSANRTGR